MESTVLFIEVFIIVFIIIYAILTCAMNFLERHGYINNGRI